MLNAKQIHPFWRVFPDVGQFATEKPQFCGSAHFCSKTTNSARCRKLWSLIISRM